MGVSVPLIIASWLLTQQPGSPTQTFDIDGRAFAASSVSDRGFLNVGPVPVTSSFAPGTGSLQLDARERVGATSATWGDKATLRATLQMGLDQVEIELLSAGFPPLASLPAGAGTGAIPPPPNSRINGGVLVGGWVHGGSDYGFRWGGRAPVAFSVYGVGRVSVNGQPISERAAVQVHALRAGRFSDDDRHLLQPMLRDGDFEVQVIATQLPRDLVPNGFVELHYDEVRIVTPEGSMEDTGLIAAEEGARAGVALPEPAPGGLVFQLPNQLPGVGGSGFIDSSGDALSGSGPAFGRGTDPTQLGFLSGTGPAFGTPQVQTPQGNFSGTGRAFDPRSSPSVGGGASVSNSGLLAPDATTGGVDPATGRPTGTTGGTTPGAETGTIGLAPAPRGSAENPVGQTTPSLPIGPDALTTGGGQVSPNAERGVLGQTVPQTPPDGEVVVPGATGAVVPGTPVRGELIGEPQGVTDTTDGVTSTRPQGFGPGVNTTPFGPGVNAQPFGPGAVTPNAPSGGLAPRSAPFATTEESSAGIPATPSVNFPGTQLPQRVQPTNAGPAIPLAPGIAPANSQPAAPLVQGVTPLNAVPSGTTPPPAGAGATPNPATATPGATSTLPGASNTATTAPSGSSATTGAAPTTNVPGVAPSGTGTGASGGAAVPAPGMSAPGGAAPQ